MTESDIELLKLAAKAIGLEVHDSDDGTIQRRPIVAVNHYVMGQPYCEVQWNPLRDDATALRLAADLRLQILPGKHKGDGCTVESQRPGITGCTAFRDNDPARQMRDAIVYVAAEIGKAMP